MARRMQIPDREPGEQPATDKQIDYLRHLADFDEAELAKLGKWQASALIDQLTEARDQGGPPKRSKKGCCLGIAILLLCVTVGVGVFWTVAALSNRDDDPPRPKPPAVPEREAAPDRPSPAAKVDSDPAKIGKPAVEPPSPPERSPWPPGSYPAIYEATELVKLLAEDGSEVEIEPGQKVEVLQQPRPNVWRFRYGGAGLVGSGSRVEGKLRPVEE